MLWIPMVRAPEGKRETMGLVLARYGTTVETSPVKAQTDPLQPAQPQGMRPRSQASQAQRPMVIPSCPFLFHRLAVIFIREVRKTIRSEEPSVPGMAIDIQTLCVLA